MSLSARIARLENHRLASAYSSMTYDELHLAILENARGIILDAHADPDDVVLAIATVAEIERDIVVTARKLLDPEYRSWLKSDFGLQHVPAVTCGSWHGSGETNDLGKPRIMQRRAALRASGTVQSILKEAGLVAIN